MKPALFFLVLAGCSRVLATDIYSKVEIESARVRDIEGQINEARNADQKLRSRLRAAVKSGEQKEKQIVEEMLDENRQVLVALSKMKQQAEERHLKTLKSREWKFLRALPEDHRIPRKEDISGRWSAPATLAGYVIQLTQRGKQITGRGFDIGCTGIGKIFDITGSIENGLLSLTFSPPEGNRRHKYFRYSEIRGRIGFDEIGSPSKQRISPFVQMP